MKSEFGLTNKFMAQHFHWLLFLVFSASTCIYSYTSLPYQWSVQSGANGIEMHLQLGSPDQPLNDGSTTWGEVAESAVNEWNSNLDSSRFQFRVVRNSTIPIKANDGKNSVFWSSTVYGQSFGSALAVATAYFIGGVRTEADVVFNTSSTWNSFRGINPKAENKGSYDFRRVALHEFGHVLGLGHPDQAGQNIPAVMRSGIGGLDSIVEDDIEGGQSLWGRPQVPPSVTLSPAEIQTNTSPITFTISFSKAVTGLNLDEVEVMNAAKNSLTGSGDTYMLAVTPLKQGAVTCKVPMGVAQDSDGKENTPSNSASVIYDTIRYSAPIISNFAASQRPGMKVVDINYDLVTPRYASAAVTLQASSDGGITWTVPTASATGALGVGVAPATGKLIVWNAGLDWPLNSTSQMCFRLTADDGFALIPEGAFTMGGETDVYDAPPTTVNVGSFYMQQTETTKGQWDAVKTWGLINGYTDLAVGGGKAANHPVHSVNFWDVLKWCNARSEQEGLTPVYSIDGLVMRKGYPILSSQPLPVPNWEANGYRLPTEAEWEKAARGGVTGKRFPWGTSIINHNYANYSSNSLEYAYDKSGYISNTMHPKYAIGTLPYTAPVGSFFANGYGLYDMSGNVWEWCWDFYDANYYYISAGTTDPRGPSTGSFRCARGGGWRFDALECRCGYRRPPENPNYVSNQFGFRTARNAN